MEDNWDRMETWSAPLTIHVFDGYVYYHVCNTPIVSLMAPIATSPCGRKGNFATALDNSSLVLENTYGDNV